MKATLYHWLKLVLSIVFFLITIVTFIGYSQQKNVALLVMAIIMFTALIITNILLSIKVKKELIKRDEQIRISEREKHEQKKSS